MKISVKYSTMIVNNLDEAFTGMCLDSAKDIMLIFLLGALQS